MITGGALIGVERPIASIGVFPRVDLIRLQRSYSRFERRLSPAPTTRASKKQDSLRKTSWHVCGCWLYHPRGHLAGCPGAFWQLRGEQVGMHHKGCLQGRWQSIGEGEQQRSRCGVGNRWFVLTSLLSGATSTIRWSWLAETRTTAGTCLRCCCSVAGSERGDCMRQI